MEALPLRAGRTNCMSNIQQDMIEQTLAILASMMQQAAHDATLYCAEAKRTVIMPRDIELALKRLVLPGSAYWTRAYFLALSQAGDVDLAPHDVGAYRGAIAHQRLQMDLTCWRVSSGASQCAQPCRELVGCWRREPSSRA